MRNRGPVSPPLIHGLGSPQVRASRKAMSVLCCLWGAGTASIARNSSIWERSNQDPPTPTLQASPSSKLCRQPQETPHARLCGEGKCSGGLVARVPYPRNVLGAADKTVKQTGFPHVHAWFHAGSSPGRDPDSGAALLAARPECVPRHL